MGPSIGIHMTVYVDFWIELNGQVRKHNAMGTCVGTFMLSYIDIVCENLWMAPTWNLS